MAVFKPVYKNPKPGQPLLATISSGCQTPILEIKYSNIISAFYYPNSQTVPRYSVTCVVDPELHKEFLKGIQTIEKNENVETIIKNDLMKQDGNRFTTGNLNIKFQTKDIIPVFIRQSDDDKSDGEQIELEDELAKGERVKVIYDILRYTKKNTMKTEHGISFKPTCIYYYPNKNTK
jgi:hypothetical protein